MIPRFHPILLGTALTLAPLTAGAQAAADPPPVAGVTEISVGQTAGQMYVPVDKSELLRVEHAFRDIRVGNRDIAEVQPLSKGVVYVLGKKYGTTNLTLRDSSGAVVAVIDVVVTYDIDGLKRQIRELFPNEHVDVTGSGDAIALSGAVSSSDQLRQILALADHYAPGKVANLLSLGGSQQVLLEVKFCEVQRSALKNIDANANLNYASGGDVINSGSGPVFSGTPGGVDPTKAFGAITGVFTHGLWTTSAGFEALENKGIIRTLAEPNLVALSGDTANFLAGGEIPIPVQTTQAGAGGYPTVTLEYKDYGVGLSFTPTIIGKQLVNLAMISEVSSIDNSQAFKENGFSIPALKCAAPRPRSRCGTARASPSPASCRTISPTPRRRFRASATCRSSAPCSAP